MFLTLFSQHGSVDADDGYLFFFLTQLFNRNLLKVLPRGRPSWLLLIILQFLPNVMRFDPLLILIAKFSLSYYNLFSSMQFYNCRLKTRFEINGKYFDCLWITGLSYAYFTWFWRYKKIHRYYYHCGHFRNLSVNRYWIELNLFYGYPQPSTSTHRE